MSSVNYHYFTNGGASGAPRPGQHGPLDGSDATLPGRVVRFETSVAPPLALAFLRVVIKPSCDALIVRD